MGSHSLRSAIWAITACRPWLLVLMDARSVARDVRDEWNFFQSMPYRACIPKGNQAGVTELNSIVLSGK